MVGDFNIVASTEERIGGATPNFRTIEEFNKVFLKSGLVSVQFEGLLFTRTNRKLWQHLDRAAINSS